MEGDFIITSEEIRRHNRTIVEKYMTMVGQERENRWKTFTDDATTDLQYTATGESLVISGIDNIRQGDKFNCKNSPNCGFTNIEIFCSDNPHSFPLNAMAKEPPMFPAGLSITRTTMFISFCSVTGKSVCTASS